MVAVLAAQTTEDRILDATERLLAAMGLRKMTMEDVAAEAGLTRRTVYKYFGSKQELAFASIDRVVSKVRDKLEDIAVSDSPVQVRLKRMALARITVRLEAVQSYRMSLDSVFEVIRPAYMERRKEYFRREAEIFAVVIREGVGSRRLKPVDPDETADLLLQATNAFLPYSLSPDELGRTAEVKKRLEAMADIFVAGISK
ncbi:MAG: TetR/AcrR family transcriptional regulator [Armatimonadetes bacterium]|nr:TetR/AcrR family transcriptional regulator [Armatimonadota bacterium]